MGYAACLKRLPVIRAKRRQPDADKAMVAIDCRTTLAKCSATRAGSVQSTTDYGLPEPQ